jgi:hypothetical protein
MEGIAVFHAPPSNGEHSRRGIENTRSDFLVEFRNEQRHLLCDFDEAVGRIEANGFASDRATSNVVTRRIVGLYQVVATTCVDDPTINLTESGRSGLRARAATPRPDCSSWNSNRRFLEGWYARAFEVREVSMIHGKRLLAGRGKVALPPRSNSLSATNTIS